LLWVLVGLAAVVQLNVIAGLARNVSETLRIGALPEDQQQRYLNGPIVSYARELRDVLPVDSCLEFDAPEIQDFRTHGGNFISQRASVLETTLYPRALRLVADVPEGLDAAACGTAPAYLLIWMEAGNAADLQFASHLEALNASSRAIKVSSYTDGDGNTGATFQILGRPA
jgi:hypothetical protein